MNIQKIVLTAVAILGITTAVLGFALITQAANPTLTLYNNSNNTVQITVNGDANANVVLYYQNNNNWLSAYLGMTNSSGYFSTTISQSTYNIPYNSSVYVLVNNQQSQYMTWGNNNQSGSLSLSQTNINIAAGQSITVSATNGSSLYISNNSNSNVANAYTSGSQVTITGNNYGSTTITVCSQSYNACSPIYVSVTSYGNNNQTISFDNQNPTIVVGQNQAIKISGPANYYGYVSYSISSNSNSNVVGASINNNYITISGLSTGSSTITVCASSGGCSSLYVTVNYGNYNYYNYNYSGNLSLSQTNLTLTMGQSANITVYGAGNYYISSNSSQNIASTSISGNTLYVYGNNTGNTNITVCQYNGQCATLYVNVTFSNAYNNYNYNYNYNPYSNYNYNYNQPFSLSSNDLNINLGQTAYVSINGTGSFYVASNSNQNVAVVLAASNNVLIYGTNSGNTTASVCQSGGQCVNLYISVNNNNGQTYPLTCPVCNCGNR
jgi:hypothetical protein